jgi:hypothetical protein
MFLRRIYGGSPASGDLVARLADYCTGVSPLAIAMVLEGSSRSDAAAAAGMDVQTLRD